MTFKDQVVADWPVYNNTDEFGVSGLWNGTIIVGGNLFVEYVDIPSDGITAGMSVFSNRFMYQKSELPDAAQGDSIVINSIDYAIDDVQTSSDGEGLLVLSLPDGVY